MSEGSIETDWLISIMSSDYIPLQIIRVRGPISTQVLSQKVNQLIADLDIRSVLLGEKEKVIFLVTNYVSGEQMSVLKGEIIE